MKPTTARLLTFALALGVAVALLNLAQNLQSLSFGEGVRYGLPRVGVGTEGLGPFINPAILAWVLALAALVIFVVGWLWKGSFKGRFPFIEFLPLILGGLLLFSIIFINAGLTEPPPEDPEAGGVDPGEGPPGEGDPNANEPLPFFFRGDLRLGPESLGLVIAFLAFSAVYLLLSRLRFVGRRGDLESWRGKRELREKVKGVLGERIYRLELGDDIRSVILGAYRDMVHLFHSYGLRTHGFQTAREVETMAASTLGLSGEASHELRRRFEEARYSLHPLTEDQRTAAIESLRRVRRELGA